MYNNLRTKIIVPGNDNLGVGLRTPGYLRQPIPRNGLVGEWLLNGNAQDTSGYGNHLTATNVTYTDTDLGYQKQCGSFDGSTSKINTPNIIGTLKDFYFSGWINHNLSTYGKFYRDDYDFQKTFTIHPTDSYFAINVGGVWIGESGAAGAVHFPISTNTWHHIVINYILGVGVYIYLDTVLKSYGLSTSTTGTSGGAVGGAYGMYLPNTTEPFNGKMELLKQGTKYLTQKEIQTLYLEGLKLLH